MRASRLLVPTALSFLLVAFAGCLEDAEPTPAFEAEPEPEPKLQSVQAVDITGLEGDDDLPDGFAGELVVRTIGTGMYGPEPNVGVTSSGCVFATAWSTIVRSCDLGTTWDSVYTQQLGINNDAMLWVDPTTDRVMSHPMFPTLTCSSTMFSDDDGATWIEVPGMSCGSPVIDHQKVASGPFSEPLPPGAVYETLVSYCYNKLTSTQCAFSLDGGVTFAYETLVDQSPLTGPSVDGGLSCGGLNGHQHHGADGTIYVPFGYNCGTAHVAVSEDNGMSWRVENLAFDTKSLDPEVTTTPDGTAYYLYRGQNHTMQLIRSTDRFQTWSEPITVSPDRVANTMFQGMSAGSDGRVAVAYLGTEDDSFKGSDNAGNDTVWHLYVGLSLDANASTPRFVTVQATDDPVQRGSICMEQACVDGNRNLLDFIDLHVGPDGRPWVAFTDGCTSSKCHGPDGTPQDSRDSALALATVDAGPSLLAKVGRLG